MRSRFLLCLPAVLLPAAAFAADEAPPKPIEVVKLDSQGRRLLRQGDRADPGQQVLHLP